MLLAPLVLTTGTDLLPPELVWFALLQFKPCLQTQVNYYIFIILQLNHQMHVFKNCPSPCNSTRMDHLSFCYFLNYSSGSVSFLSDKTWSFWFSVSSLAPCQASLGQIPAMASKGFYVLFTLKCSSRHVATLFFHPGPSLCWSPRYKPWLRWLSVRLLDLLFPVGHKHVRKQKKEKDQFCHAADHG